MRLYEGPLELLSSSENEDESDLKISVKAYQQQIKDIEYSCLGCKHCYGAEVSNYYQEAYDV